MKIDCLMATYGRYSLACEALACFLQQSALSHATLLIYNHHPVPLRFDHPKVRVVNEAPPAGVLRHIRQRMHELADPSATFIHWWEDDDLYLPWHVEDCLEHIKDSVAWKPASSWMSEGNVKFSRVVNWLEGSWVFRSDYLKQAPLHTHPTYIDHPVICQVVDRGELATTELGGRTSYIYRWATGTEHLSGYGGSGSEETQRNNIESWRRRCNDTGPNGRLVPADMTLRWRQYLDGIKGQIAPAEWQLNRTAIQRALGGQAMPELQDTMLDLIPLPNPDAQAEVLDAEILLYHPGQTRAVYLNSTAAMVWSLCDGIRSVRQIIGFIGDSYPDADANLTEDVLATLKLLRESGVLVVG